MLLYTAATLKYITVCSEDTLLHHKIVLCTLTLLVIDIPSIFDISAHSTFYLFYFLFWLNICYVTPVNTCVINTIHKDYGHLYRNFISAIVNAGV